jgi:hypothetical protein
VLPSTRTLARLAKATETSLRYSFNQFLNSGHLIVTRYGYSDFIIGWIEIFLAEINVLLLVIIFPFCFGSLPEFDRVVRLTGA